MLTITELKNLQAQCDADESKNSDKRWRIAEGVYLQTNAGVKQTEIAKELNVSPMYISYIRRVWVRYGDDWLENPQANDWQTRYRKVQFEKDEEKLQQEILRAQQRQEEEERKQQLQNIQIQDPNLVGELLNDPVLNQVRPAPRPNDVPPRISEAERKAIHAQTQELLEPVREALKALPESVTIACVIGTMAESLDELKAAVALHPMTKAELVWFQEVIGSMGAFALELEATAV